MLFFLAVIFNNKLKVHSFSNCFSIRIAVVSVSIMLSVVVIYGFWHTLISTKEVVYFKDRHLIQSINDKDSTLNTIYFEHASTNPIYKPLVEVNMNIMVEKALSNKNLFEVLQYVRWANAYPFYINRRESVKNLFISYIYLGEFKRAKELLIEKKEIMGLEQYKKLGRLLGEYK